ncbi:MAG TPA: hypothetical protein VFF68_03765, partial [Anaerolineaceae bacterium]|nr:hypothetical protein [Anaerolineaceae bacterium]
WTRGSAIYTQNKDGNRIISDNITFRNFTTGMKAYTEGAYVNGFKFYGNVLFMNNDRNIFASGRDNPARGLEMIGNMTYRPADDDERSLTVGYANEDQHDAVVKDNYIVNGTNDLGALYVKRASTLTVTGNTLVSNGNLVTFYQAGSVDAQAWDGNRYFAGAGELFQAEDQGMGFDEWRAATGFDANSSYSEGRPTENAVFVRPNQYEPKRANVVVYNWQGAGSVDVDLSGVLQPGDSYRIVDAQNFFGDPVVSGTYEGGAVSLPMELSAVAPITGELKHFSNNHTPSEFNVFVVLPN